MRVISPAKINLRLKVVGRRSDGYHLLSMLNLACDFFDYLEVNKTSQPGIELEVSPPGAVSSECDNLVYRAAEAFFRNFKIGGGARFALTKNIPLGSGLGGGSSNAAAALKALRELYSEELAAEGFSAQEVSTRLLAISSQLGSDVPFFLSGGLARVNGVGEIVEPLNSGFLTEFSFLLLLPEESIPTAAVYQKLRSTKVEFAEDALLPSFFERAFIDDRERYFALLDLIDNDLQPVVENSSPLIGEIFTRMRALPEFVPCLSGSGSAIFLLSKAAPSISSDQSALIKERLRDLPVTVRITHPA